MFTRFSLRPSLVESKQSMLSPRQEERIDRLPIIKYTTTRKVVPSMNGECFGLNIVFDIENAVSSGRVLIRSSSFKALSYTFHAYYLQAKTDQNAGVDRPCIQPIT